MDAHQLRYTRRTREGEGEGGIDGVTFKKVYSTATSRIYGHIGVDICLGML